MIRDRVTFRLDTYLVLIEDLNLGEPPTTLGGNDRWYSDEETAHRRRNAYAELEQHGLARNGRLDDEFVETIHVLQRPGVEHYTFATINDRSFTVRTAAIGKDAVLVICDGAVIDLYPGEPERLPEQLFHALPSCQAATLHSLSCRATDYQAVLDGKSVQSGPSGRDAKMIARWLGLPRHRGGQLFTAARKSTGGRQRSGSPPRWFDTDHGRIFTYFDSTGFLNLVPGTVDKFGGRLRALEDELRQS